MQRCFNTNQANCSNTVQSPSNSISPSCSYTGTGERSDPFRLNTEGTEVAERAENVSILSRDVSWAIATPDHSPMYQRAVDTTRRFSAPDVLTQRSAPLWGDLRTKLRRFSAPEVLARGASSQSTAQVAPSANSSAGLKLSLADLTRTPSYQTTMPTVPREDLAKICAPFFEQMIAAVNAVVQERTKTSHQSPSPTAQVSTSGIMHATQDSAPNFKTETSTLGHQSTSKVVCFHWKNKGWCKYEDSCRFSHPAEKRGKGKPRQAPILSCTAPAKPTTSVMNCIPNRRAKVPSQLQQSTAHSSLTPASSYPPFLAVPVTRLPNTDPEVN